MTDRVPVRSTLARMYRENGSPVASDPGGRNVGLFVSRWRLGSPGRRLLGQFDHQPNEAPLADDLDRGCPRVPAEVEAGSMAQAVADDIRGDFKGTVTINRVPRFI